MEEKRTFTFTKEDALNKLADGHSILYPEAAKALCDALGVDYNPKLERRFFDEPEIYKGAEIPPENEGGLGVACLTLGSWIVRRLGAQDKAEGFIGRGFQAREYSRVVRAVLETEATTCEECQIRFFCAGTRDKPDDLKPSICPLYQRVMGPVVGGKTKEQS